MHSKDSITRSCCCCYHSSSTPWARLVMVAGGKHRPHSRGPHILVSETRQRIMEQERKKAQKAWGATKRQSNFAFFFFKGCQRFLQVNGHFGSQWRLHWLWGPASPRYILVWGSLRPLICDTGSQFPLPRAEPFSPVSMIYGMQYTREGLRQSRKKRTLLRSPHPPPHLLQREMKGR